MRKLLALAALLALLAPVSRADAYTKLTDVRVAMDDGVVLTADVYVPTIADRDGDGLYPCVVELTPYRKESRYSEGASFLPDQGIALIEVDARGTGGSQGEYDIVFSVREQRDMAEWIDWAALNATKPNGSPLCEQTVGAYGGSYSGIIQYLAASLPLQPGDVGYGRLPMGSPYLTAIAPQRAYGDLYRDIVYHGGMVIGSFGAIWSTGTTAYYTQPPSDVGTPAGQAAWLDHLSKNDPMMVPYLLGNTIDTTYTSDDTTPAYSQALYDDSSVLPRIENLRVPTLHLAGWFDAFTRGQLMTFAQAHALEQSLGGRGPNFLIIGPWNHTGTHFITPDQGFRPTLAQWYHWWLEDEAAGAVAPAWITNGFDGNGARAKYFQMVSGKINSQTAADGTWRTSESWPPSSIDPRRFFFKNGGVLTTQPPAPYDSSTVDFDAWTTNPAFGTAEILSRWDNAAGTPQPQWDQRLETGKGLTYQTDALAAPLTVAGPIGMHIWAGVTSTPGTGGLLDPEHNDTDFVVKVSDVSPDGTATLVTQGYLRASHRAYDPNKSSSLNGTLLAPYHLHTEASLDKTIPLLAPTLYEIEIWPTAKTFGVGHRLRIDVASTDTPNHFTLLKPSVNTLWRSDTYQSWIALPVVN